ncbi:MAG: glycoside hydrolase family 26 protein [Bacillota bacterium]|jgi:hypothetical protein
MFKKKEIKKRNTVIIPGAILIILTSLFTVYCCSVGNPFAQACINSGNYALGRYEPAEGCYLGAYVLQDESLNGDMQAFNTAAEKKHATFFRYFGYKEGKIEDLSEWLNEAEAAGAAPQVALEPNLGLDEVQGDAYLIKLAKTLNQVEGPVFLRFASEMNGNWAAYSGDPQKYIEKWRLVHDVMEKYAPRVLMLWTVFSNPTGNMDAYYPGDDYVDWVGVNIYNVIYHNNDINDLAVDEDPLEFLDYVYNHFSGRKPIQISEYGVSHYTITDGKNYTNFACEKLTRLYSNLKNKYPRVKAIYYFDVNNLVNAPEGRRINDYSLTGDKQVLAVYQKLIADEYFLSDIQEDRAGQIAKDLK